ncbi:MAG: hypothetical protein ACLR39_04280 [Oscillospiraceae bacterium]
MLSGKRKGHPAGTGGGVPLLYARNLTLNRLSEAVILPLYPDKGGCMTYDLSRTASTYLEEDIELLKRVRPAE